MSADRGRDVTIRRSDRARHARLTIGQDGSAVVVLPRRAPRAVADALVARHGAWIDHHQDRISGEVARLAARPALGAGRVLVVAGRPLTVRIETATGRRRQGTVMIIGEELVVRPGRDGSPTAPLDAWLRETARSVIAERIAAQAPWLDVEPGRLTIRDQRSRWASASARGDLSFSWRLVLAPPFVLDAVVVHELAHLRIRGHGPRFWRLVERHAPRSPDARRWLREHARELRAALDDVMPPT